MRCEGPLPSRPLAAARRSNAGSLIVTYGCHLGTHADPVVSHEHKEAGLFTEAEVSTLPMPDGYKKSIATWYARLSAQVT